MRRLDVVEPRNDLAPVGPQATQSYGACSSNPAVAQALDGGVDDDRSSATASARGSRIS